MNRDLRLREANSTRNVQQVEDHLVSNGGSSQTLKGFRRATEGSAGLGAGCDEEGTAKFNYHSPPPASRRGRAVAFS